MASEMMFISEFHNIKGVSVGERKKNVQQLLKNKSFTADEARTVIDNLKPKTYLETLLYIDILIYLRQTVELLEILKNGNEACASKIIKQPWFFKEAFSHVGVDELVNDVLPTMSFSVKVKLLKKLLVVFPEEKIDKIFDAVLKRYGLFVATTVVPGCSSQKIEDILKNNGVKLRSNQLKKIYNKQPNLINIYLDVHKQEKNEGIFDDNFLVYLAQKNPDFFWDLIETYEITNDVKLGRRTTKKLIETKKNDVINEPKKYIRYFKHEALVRKLNKLGVFKQVYRNLFPKNIEKLDGEKYVLCNELLKYHPKHSQYQLFTETFSEVLHENISSNLSCLHDNILDLMTDVEAREALAQLKFKESNDNEYIKYYKTEKCFALIKEKINLTSSMRERRKLLFILVKSCGINKDLKSLEKVLKYFCERHRNDDSNTRGGILDLIGPYFKLDDLDETHWKYLNEIMTIQSLNKEYSSSRKNLLIAYIKYLFKNNRPDDDLNHAIFEYLVCQVIDFCSSLSTLSDCKDSELERRILMQAMEHAPKIIKRHNLENSKDYLLSEMIKEIFTYNSRHKKNPIILSENEKFVEILRSIMENKSASYRFYEQLVYTICKSNRNDIENEMLTYYWEKSIAEQHHSTKPLHWYLKYEPSVIVDNIESIMKLQPRVTSNIWFRIKSYSHLNLDDIVIKYCLELLKDDNDVDKSEYVRAISILATPEYYIKIIEEGNLIPTTSKLVIEDEKAKNIYKQQRAFLKNFRNVKDPIQFLPMLIDKFCQGDYLKSSLIALYGAFYNCPEHELKPHLYKLAKNNAVSVKKHALNLACCVFDQQTALTMLNDFEANEKNISLQKCMFSICLRYFSRNPDEKLFEKMISFMGFLKERDEESLNILPTVHIYRNYKPYYIQNVLKLLIKFADNDKEESKTVTYNNVISSTLDKIDKECVQKLPQVFCQEIIRKFFLTNHSIPAIFPFVIKYLLYRVEENDNFNFIFKLLSNYKLQFWNNSSMVKEQKNIYTFFNTFYEESCKTEVTSDFVLHFSSNWEKTFTPIEAFEEHVLLNLLQFKKDSEKELESYSQKIVLFSEKLVEEFGQMALPKFVTVLGKSSNLKKKEKINLLSNMLKFKTTRLNCILVLELIILENNLFYKDKIRPVYREIDCILKEITDPNVQLFYNLYLKI